MDHSLISVIEPSRILLDVSLSSKEEVIDLFAQTLMKQNIISSKEGFENDVLQRESIVATGIGNSIAIPHALSSFVFEAALVYIRLSNPIDWSGDQVEHVFGIAVPEENMNNVHLKILSSIARKMLEDDFGENVTECNDKYHINDYLNNSIGV